MFLVITPESCIVFTTHPGEENDGKVIISLGFQVSDNHNPGVVHIEDEPWTYCFPSGDLLWYSLQSSDEDRWLGDISITHTDQSFSSLMQCGNCNCQCTSDGDTAEYCQDDGVPRECLEENVINIGLAGDEDAEGDTKCLNSQYCPFSVVWTVEGTCIYRFLTKLDAVISPLIWFSLSHVILCARKFDMRQRRQN